MSKLQLMFNESRKGWVSFLTHYPDFMATLGNKYLTVKYGNIYEHNDIANPTRGVFYSEGYHPSKVSFYVNIPNNEDVVFKTVKIEGNDAWDLHLRTNMTNGSLLRSEFNKRESYFYTHFRKNESTQDFTGLKVNGIGIIDNYLNGNFTFTNVNEEVNTGDKLYYTIGASEPVFIGTIASKTQNNIYIEDMEISVVPNQAFCFAIKDSRTEGSDLRGYYAEVTITNDNINKTELYAVVLNTAKSYV